MGPNRRAQERQISEQRYRRDDQGIDRLDVVLMLIVAVFAFALVVAALWIGLR
jgi:hypothetical protein